MQEAFRDWILAADPTGFWVLIAVAGVLTAFAWFGAVSCYRRARLIKDTPTARIRSAPQGHVEITGHAQPHEGRVLSAPLSKKPCVWYRYEIRKKVSQPSVGPKGLKVRHSWKRIEGEASTLPFIVDDGTGTCVVHPNGADTMVDTEDTWYGSSHYPTSGPRGTWMDHFGRYRYHEERIEPESALYAMGWFKTIGASGDTDLREEIRDGLSALKRDQEQLLARFDHDRDGDISMPEWERARAAVREETILARAKRAATQSNVHTLGQAPERRFPFLLATKSQHHLAREQKFQGLALATLFVASGGFSLSALLVRFGS